MIQSLRNPAAKFAPQFPDPYQDVASYHVPTEFRALLRWGEKIWYANGAYRVANERLISYFLTEIGIDKVDPKVRDKWVTFLDRTLQCVPFVQQSLRNRMAYGNEWFSFYIPFKRFLVCRNCAAKGERTDYSLEEVYENPAYKFKFELPRFVATCPVCGDRGEWRVDDRDGDLQSDLRLTHWNPHYMDTLYEETSGNKRHYWRIPERYKRHFKLNRPHLLHLESVPYEILKAVARNQYFMFDRDAIFHMAEPVLTGVETGGLGVPKAVGVHKELFLDQVYQRQDEALGLDFVVPFRTISPEPTAGGSSRGVGGGPLLDTMDGGDFAQFAKRMIAEHRWDPASIHTMPVPVRYQVFGAEANQFSPAENRAFNRNSMLNSSQTPMQLYQGDLQIQAAPVALRLHESEHRPMVTDMTQALLWILRKVAELMTWDPVDGSWKRVSVADNIEKLALSAQLAMSGGGISQSGLLEDLGKDWYQEQRRLADEARFQAKMKEKLDEEAAQTGLALQMTAPPAPAGGGQSGGPAPAGQDPNQPMMGTGLPVDTYLQSAGGNTSMSFDELSSVAQSLATELLAIPEAPRRSQLRKLRQVNNTLADATLSEMERQREDVRRNAGDQAVSQMVQVPMQ